MDPSLYDELHRVEETHWWFRARRHIVWSLVRRYMKCDPGRRLQICELGCGTGGNLATIANEHDIVGIECSMQALAYAQQKFGNRVRYGRLPHEIDVQLQSFDVVLLTDVLEHIEDDALSARMALKLLRPGGVLVATVPAYQWLYSPRDAHHHHFRRYSKRRFAGLWQSADAQLELLSYYNSLLFAPAAAVRLASKMAPRRFSSGDLSLPPQFFNKLLTSTMQCEANLLGRLPMPFGLSLIAVVRKGERSVKPLLRAAA
jgi:SAM-dependent methyltransferase